MKNLCLVTGGSRSGKSRYALELALRQPRRVFLATAEAMDDEMKARITRHQQERGEAFTTVEEPLDLAKALRALPAETDVVLIDCLSVWLGNLMHHHGTQTEYYDEIHAFLEVLETVDFDVIIVTNEVGMGIIPHDEMTRAYRDLAGWLNQDIAQRADTAVLLVSGLPLMLKENGH